MKCYTWSQIYFFYLKKQLSDEMLYESVIAMVKKMPPHHLNARAII